MDVRGQRTGRPARRHRDEPGAVGAPERPRPLGLPARCAAAPAAAARQPDRGLAAAPMAASVRRGTMTLLTQATGTAARAVECLIGLIAARAAMQVVARWSRFD